MSKERRLCISFTRNGTSVKKDAVFSCRATRHREYGPICHPSGIDVGGLRGSLNAATGTHEFGLDSVLEIIEGTVESSSV